MPSLQARQRAPGADQPALGPVPGEALVPRSTSRSPRPVLKDRGSFSGGLAEAEASWAARCRSFHRPRRGGRRASSSSASTRASAPFSSATSKACWARSASRCPPPRQEAADEPTGPSTRPPSRVSGSVGPADRGLGLPTSSGWPTPGTSPSACGASRRRRRPCARASTPCTRCSRPLPAAGPARAEEGARRRHGAAGGRGRTRPRRRPHRGRLRVHREHRLRPRLQPVPDPQQALSDDGRALLRDPPDPPPRDRAAAAGRRAGLLGARGSPPPGLPRRAPEAGGPEQIVMNGHVLAYLMADPWTTGRKLLASPA